MSDQTAEPTTSATKTTGVTAADWLAALDTIKPAIAARPPIPILCGVVVTPTADGVTLGAFDYETSAATTIGGGHTVGTDPFLVSHSWLVRTLKAIGGKKGASTVTLTHERGVTTVAAGGYAVPTDTRMDVKDYPDLPVLADTTVTVDTATLKAALNRVAVAASADGTIPILTAACIEVGPGGIQLWGTDRYRLAADYVPAETDTETNFLLKMGTWKGLAKHLVEPKTSIGFSTHDGFDQITIRNGPHVFTEHGVGGEYPNIRSLFPEYAPTTITVDRAALIESTTVAGRLVAHRQPCRFQVAQEGVTVVFATEDNSLSSAPVARAVAQTDVGDGVDTAFNPGYLLDALRSFTTDTVTVSFTKPYKPVVFTAGGVDCGDTEAYRHLLMPVRFSE